jgi:hypothetical protein
MKSFVLIISILISGLLAGYSGIATIGHNKTVSPSYLAQFRGGGSISTLWYRGSDQKYHYFSHYIKVRTNYRIHREELKIDEEFPYKSKEPLFVGNKSYWTGL